MKILYLVQHFSGRSGAGSSRVYENARRLVSAGHEVTLLCGRLDRSSDADVEDAERAGIRIQRAPILYSQRFSYLQRMVVFRRYMTWAERTGRDLPRVDVVFASSTPLTVGDVGRKLSRHHRAPFVFEVRDLWPEVPETVGALRNPGLRWLAHRMARRVYGAADRVVALSPGMADVIRDRWGVPAGRIDVIPNCSDNDLFGTPEVDAARESTRRRLGWDGAFVAIHPGAMGVANGLDYLLDAAKVLDHSADGAIRLVLLGQGAVAPHLERRIREEAIRSATIHPPVPKREVPEWLAAADAGVVSFLPKPFLDTNSANKFFDLLAAGKPIILNYDGWQGRVLRESGAGLSVDPRRPEALAEALRGLRDAPERVRAMGAAARTVAEARFDRDTLASQLVAVLERTVREARR
jgi:glycosyltransferase involved in cell wall biosynthesis